MEILGNGRVLLLQPAQSISGHGTLAAPGNVLVLSLTSVPVDLASTAGHPRRIFRAGWVGTQLTGSVLQVWPVGYDNAYQFEVDERAEYVWWDLASGVTATIKLGRELEMRTPVGCRVHCSANHLIPNATWTSIPFDVEEHDGWGMVDLGSHSTRLTAVVTGWHLVTAGVQFEFNATGLRGIAWVVNAAVGGPNIIVPANGDSGVSTGLSLADHLYLTAGDYVEIQALHTKGSGLNVVSPTSACLMLVEAGS